MHTFIFPSWSRSRGWWERCSRGCVTWKLATCYAAALNSESAAAPMRTGVNAAIAVSTAGRCDWSSRRALHNISAVTCTHLTEEAGGPQSKRRAWHPVGRVHGSRLTGSGSFICFSVLLSPVCFILMPPCCQSDKTFATAAVSVHLRQIGSPHCFWMIILQHHVSHWFIFKESRYYFFYRPPFLYKQRWYIGLVIGGLNYMAWK